MIPQVIKISRKDLQHSIPKHPLEEYNDIYLDYSKFNRLKNKGAKFDFLRDKLIKEGNVSGIGLINDKLDRIWNLIEYKELRKDFVTPKELKRVLRLDMKAPDLFNDKAQQMINQYRTTVLEGESMPTPEDLITDMKPAYSELGEQLITDFETLKAKEYKRNSAITGRELINKYRIGDSTTTSDMIAINPVEDAKELKQLEEIYRRFEQGTYLVADMDIKDQISQKKDFLVSEIKRLKGQLLNTELSSIERKEVQDLVYTLVDRKMNAIDWIKEKGNKLKEKYFL